MSAAHPLGFALEGRRVRSAAEALEREGPLLAAALRRALPFLSRRAALVTTGRARAMPIAELSRTALKPFYRKAFSISPGGAQGLLVFDGNAVAACLDGVLGGDGNSAPVLEGDNLSPAQAALAARVAEGVLRALSDVLTARVGLRLDPLSAGRQGPSEGGTLVVCTLEFGVADEVGRVYLLLPKEALLVRETEPVDVPVGDDPRVAAALGDVDIELVAELGRVRMKLGDVVALKPGDVVRLDLALSSMVAIRVDGNVVLRGRPTTTGGQIAVKVDRHKS